MLILSKYKDYYDYLIGIWGSDPKLILDRTEYTYTKEEELKDYDTVTLYICNYMVQGMYYNKIWYFGDHLKPFAKEGDKWYKWWYREKESTYYIPTPTKLNCNSVTLLRKAKLIPEQDSPNIKEKCPILKGGPGSEYSKFPILKEYQFNRVFTAEQIWIMLSEWLSARLDMKVPDNQSDKEKIISHGYDTKTSFRKM